MSAIDLAHLLQNIGRPKIMVLGDLILDRYTWGNAERISQEAPVIVLRVDRREARLGGAANVANMLSGLGADVTCCGVVGEDSAGIELGQLLVATDANCDCVMSDPARPTSVKERFVGRAASRHPSQILRVDHERCEPLDAELEKYFIEFITANLTGHDALLISDYGKGVCTTRLLAAAIAAANESGVPAIVDPARTCFLSRYRGVTLIKPNRVEAEMATGGAIAGPADALVAGHQLCQELDAQMALITLDRDGMMLVHRDGSGESFSTEARAVYDITGAGDMSLAMIGLCLAAGTRAADAVRLANVAAGLEVERAGVAVIFREEIISALVGNNPGGGKIVTRQQLASLADEHRARGEKIVFTNGCFDLLHIGHVSYLAEAAAQGDVLVVGLNSDASVSKLKGPTRPIIGEQDRAAILAALAAVQYVVIFDEETPHELLQAIRPDVLVKGGTYTPDEVVGHEVVEAYGGRVCVTGAIPGISTTNILASLQPTGDANSNSASASSDPARGHSPHPLRRAG